MNKTYLFIQIVISLAFICIVIAAVSSREKSYMLPEVVNVVDGDTINVILSPLKDYPEIASVKIRIRNIDTPESTWRAKCPKEKELGLKAKKFLEVLIGDVERIKVTNYEWGKYGGRIIADVSVKGIDIGSEMINNGYARTYYGEGSKPNWCE